MVAGVASGAYRAASTWENTVTHAQRYSAAAQQASVTQQASATNQASVIAAPRTEVSVDVSVESHRINFVSIGGKNITHGVDLGRDGLTIRVGNQMITVTGSFASGQDLVDVLNRFGPDGLTASMDNRGRLNLHAFQPVVVSGDGAGRRGVNIGGSDPAVYVTPLRFGGVETTIDAHLSVTHTDLLQARLDSAASVLDLLA